MHPLAKRGPGMAYEDLRTCHFWHCLLCYTGQALGKWRTRILRRTFYTYGIFLFLSSITPAPPLVYKREGKAPH